MERSMGGRRPESGGPQASIVPFLRLSSSARKELAETEVTTLHGREQLWGKTSMCLLSQSVHVSRLSIHASICVQPGEM